jgi:hypothetical protein
VVQIKIEIDKIYLILVFSTILFIGYSNLVDNRINHDFPYGYLASDAFQHQTRAQGVKDAGNYRNEANYIVFGIDDVIGYYPPIIYQLSALLSHASKLEVYDTIQLVVFLTMALSVIVVYLIIRKFNKNVAILSLPLSVLLFYNGLYTGSTWGHWPSILSQFFLISFFWYIANIDLKNSFIFFGIFLSAIIMTHTSEAIYAFLFFVIFLIYSFFTKKLDFKLIKNAVFGSIFTIIISFHFLVIFRNVWMVRQPYSFSIIKKWGGPTIFLSDFGIILVFFLIGIVSSILLFRKKNMIPFLISLSMIAFGYTNYLGFTDRAFQLRFLWPVYLSFLFGLGVYQVAEIVYKNWKTIHSVALSVIIILILTNTSFSYLPSYQKISTPGLMNSFHWEALTWISKNTPENSRIYFLYGDTYSQDAILRNAKRHHAQVTPEDFVAAINAKEIRQLFETEFPGDGGGGAVQRPSYFSFQFKLNEISSQFAGKKDICQFDYIVFDKGSRQQALAQYNILIASELLQKDFVNVAFENDLVVILKNSNIGEDCIEERNF